MQGPAVDNGFSRGLPPYSTKYIELDERINSIIAACVYEVDEFNMADFFKNLSMIIEYKK